MKGKIIENVSLKNYDERVVFVEFNSADNEELKEKHKDGLFKFKMDLGESPIIQGTLIRVDAEDIIYDLHSDLISKIYVWVETKQREQILVWGNPREDFHRLGIKARRKWKGKGIDKGEIISVYELSEDDFRVLCTEKYSENTWVDCRWRWCEGSTLEAPTSKLVINKATITGWKKQPGQKNYKNLLKYLSAELGAVRYGDVYALAIDLARHNKKTLAQLFNKYQK